MYFTHPQIQTNKENLVKIFRSFLKKPNLSYLEKKLSKIFPNKNFIFTDMGRTAFKIILEKLNLKNSQILFPAFICDIFYPILKKYNIKPIFLDADLKTFNIKIEDIPQKITEKTKAILICHTFGLPVDITKVRSLISASNFQLQVIEDCAHAFLAKYKDNFLGNFGDVSFFSLYKQFPTIRGGLLVFNKEWKIGKIKETQFSFRDFVSLLNYFSPLAFLFKKFGRKIAPKIIRTEKSKEPRGINRISLNLFVEFLDDFEKNLENRTKLAKVFQEKLKNLGFEVQEGENNVFCYLSVLVPKEIEGKRDEFVIEMKKEKVFCTRIWREPIIFNKEVQKDFKIDLKDFPNTLEIAKRIVNFPLQNYFKEKDVEKIIKATEKILEKLK
jgi:dTDP-4-amino-4,6-dideoxygalactose transaminase